jgi:hypothetical protein
MAICVNKKRWNIDDENLINHISYLNVTDL